MGRIRRLSASRTRVSVLFSEPKIPQSGTARRRTTSASGFQCSSASRKFLNSRSTTASDAGCAFQCSSGSRKFLNVPGYFRNAKITSRFSALQRAENSSIFPRVTGASPSGCWFQCSSASRKFLNFKLEFHPFLLKAVSVLFSEPKIPQSLRTIISSARSTGFSALQRAENSSMCRSKSEPRWKRSFSALQRAENSSIWSGCFQVRIAAMSFSALQRAENSSIIRRRIDAVAPPRFQCSSASRKFLNSTAEC